MGDHNDFNRNQTGLEDRKTERLDEDSLYDEEFAQEMANDRTITEDAYSLNEGMTDPDLKNVYGWIGIALALISFFIAPYIFAIAGIVLGFIARGRDAKILGNFAIGLAVVSIVARLFLLPLM